jgi:hypothetical protein
MKREIAQKWAEALLNGEYVQNTEGPLRSLYGYSSLGVLCDIYRKEHSEEGIRWYPTDFDDYYFCGEIVGLPKKVMDWAEIKHPYAQLPEPNNFYGKTFTAIASIIKAEWESL